MDRQTQTEQSTAHLTKANTNWKAIGRSRTSGEACSDDPCIPSGEREVLHNKRVTTVEACRVGRSGGSAPSPALDSEHKDTVPSHTGPDST